MNVLELSPVLNKPIDFSEFDRLKTIQIKRLSTILSNSPERKEKPRPQSKEAKPEAVKFLPTLPNKRTKTYEKIKKRDKKAKKTIAAFLLNDDKISRNLKQIVLKRNTNSNLKAMPRKLSTIAQHERINTIQLETFAKKNEIRIRNKRTLLSNDLVDFMKQQNPKRLTDNGLFVLNPKERRYEYKSLEKKGIMFETMLITKVNNLENVRQLIKLSKPKEVKMKPSRNQHRRVISLLDQTSMVKKRIESM